jgi:glycine cleavage system H protein
MSNIPGNLLYTEEHEWVMVEADTLTIGITDYAQGELGDIVDVQLVDVGETFEKGDAIGTIDAVKATADIYAPVSGEIVEVNEDLPDSPDTLNADPYGQGWLYRIKYSNSSELDDLMSADDYEEHVNI